MKQMSYCCEVLTLYVWVALCQLMYFCLTNTVLKRQQRHAGLPQPGHFGPCLGGRGIDELESAALSPRSVLALPSMAICAHCKL